LSAPFSGPPRGGLSTPVMVCGGIELFHGSRAMSSWSEQTIECTSMRAAPPQTEDKPVKFHYIWLQEVAPPREGLRFLGIGILVSWGVAYFGLTSLVDWVFQKMGRGTPWGWWFATIIASLGGPIAWLMLLDWLERGGRPKRRCKPRPSLWGTPGNVERSPHQLIELALRSEPQERRRFFVGFKQIPAGEVIVAEWNWRGLPPHHPPSTTPLSIAPPALP
jgi:hypothetical protein